MELSFDPCYSVRLALCDPILEREGELREEESVKKGGGLATYKMPFVSVTSTVSQNAQQRGLGCGVLCVLLPVRAPDGLFPTEEITGFRSIKGPED